MLAKQKFLGMAVVIAFNVMAADLVFAAKVAALGKPVRVTENGETVTTRAVNCGGRSKRILRKPESKSVWCAVNVSSPCFSDARLAAKSACASKLIVKETEAPVLNDTTEAEVSEQAQEVAARKLERQAAYNKELADIDSKRKEIQDKLADIERQKKQLGQTNGSN